MLRRVALVLLLAATSLLVATGPADAAPSGCGTARRAGTRIHTLRHGGLARTYRLTVPPGYTGDLRVPLVVDLHGAGSNAREETLLTRAPARARPRGWIVATPNSAGPFWHLGRDGRDVRFLKRLVADVSRRLCIAGQRRFVMGMSNGAGLAAAATCGAPNLFRAAAPVAGLNVGGTCLGRPVALLAVHGTSDPIVPYRGGPLGGPFSRSIRVPPVTEKLRLWALRNGCAGDPAETVVVPSIRRIAYEGCQARTELLRVNRGGHTWPGGPVLPPRLGPTNQAIDATKEIFDFFQASFPPA